MALLLMILTVVPSVWAKKDVKVQNGHHKTLEGHHHRNHLREKACGVSLEDCGAGFTCTDGNCVSSTDPNTVPPEVPFVVLLMSSNLPL